MRPILIMVLVGGCSLVLDPPTDKLDGGRDGGVDGGADSEVGGDAADVGLDVGPDGGDAMLREICSNEGVDDDLDGLADCSDYDCVGAPECCGEALIIGQGLVPDWRSSGFTRLPVDSPPPSTGTGAFAESLVRFGLGSTQTLVGPCVELARGADLTLTFAPQGPDGHGCDDSNVCEDYAAVVLSPTQRLNLVSGRLQDELTVKVHASGLVELLVANEVQASQHIEPSTLAPFDVTVTFFPELLDGVAGVRATVTVNRGTPFVIGSEFIYSRNLLSREEEPACGAIPGLFIAVEGRGDGTFVMDPLRLDGRVCSNPSLFEPGSYAESASDRREHEPLTIDGDEGTANLAWNPTLGPEAGWASDALTSPAIIGIPRDPGTFTWHVLGAASDLHPSLEAGFPNLRYAIGHSSSPPRSWNSLPWSTAPLPPRLYDRLPPSCPVGDVCEEEGFRDPHVLVNAGQVVLTYVASVMGGHEIRSVSMSTGVFDDTARRIAPDVSPFSQGFTLGMERAGCSDLRDPVLVRRSDSESLLFYRCAAGRGAIYAIPINGVNILEEDAEAELVVDNSTFPGSTGLGEFEVLVDPVDGGELFRLWALGYRASGTVVSLAIGELKDGGDELLPTFVPYPSNPVATSALVCANDSRCDLTGLGLSRTPGDDARLRFLMAREVPRIGGRSRYEFVPFDQIWRASGVD